MDQDYHNDVYEEEQFEEALSARDFDTCRLVLADLEEKKFDTYEMRRMMNLAMAPKKVVGSHVPMDSETRDYNITSKADY